MYTAEASCRKCQAACTACSREGCQANAVLDLAHSIMCVFVQEAVAIPGSTGTLGFAWFINADNSRHKRGPQVKRTNTTMTERV
jgi:hypothetical protein